MGNEEVSDAPNENDAFGEKFNSDTRMPSDLSNMCSHCNKSFPTDIDLRIHFEALLSYNNSIITETADIKNVPFVESVNIKKELEENERYVCSDDPLAMPDIEIKTEDIKKESV